MAVFSNRFFQGAQRHRQLPSASQPNRVRHRAELCSKDVRAPKSRHRAPAVAFPQSFGQEVLQFPLSSPKGSAPTIRQNEKAPPHRHFDSAIAAKSAPKVFPDVPDRVRQPPGATKSTTDSYRAALAEKKSVVDFVAPGGWRTRSGTTRRHKIHH